MVLIEKFTGRESPATKLPVTILLFRQFDAKTLIDIYKVELISGSKHEVYDNLCRSEAIHKFEANKKWWS